MLKTVTQTAWFRRCLKAAACLLNLSGSVKSTYAHASPASVVKRIISARFKDDFSELAKKVRKAKAIVVGGYSPYGSIDGFTKSFIERLFSLRHQNGLSRGKLAVVVTTGNGRGAPGL